MNQIKKTKVKIINTRYRELTLAKNISYEIIDLFATEEDGNHVVNVKLSDGSCISFIINNSNGEKTVGFKVDPEFVDEKINNQEETGKGDEE